VPPATGPSAGSSEPIPSGDAGELQHREAGGSQCEESLAVFVNREKTPVLAVGVSRKHGERLGQEDATTERSRARVENIDSASEVRRGR